MAELVNEVVGFRPLMYHQRFRDHLHQVTAPGSGVTPEAAQALLERHPHNIAHITLPEELCYSNDTAGTFEKAGAIFRRWLQERVLVEGARPVVGIYDQMFELEGRRYSRRGLLAAVKLSEYGAGSMYPHETTFSAHRESQLRLLELTRTNLTPIWGVLPDEEDRFQACLRESAEGAPSLEAVDDQGVENNLWLIEEQSKLEALCRAASHDKIFIADGHHRYEAAAAYRDSSEGAEANYVLMLLVPMGDAGLVLLATHRLIPHLSGFNLSSVMEALSDDFEARKLADSTDILMTLENGLKEYAQRHVFGVYAREASYLLILKDEAVLKQKMRDCAASLRQLDVTILKQLVCPHVFGEGWKECDVDTAVGYTQSFEEAKARVDAADYACAFLLNPTPVRVVREVAEAGGLMPPKSTYFYPKPLTGLIMRRLSASRT